MVTSEDGKVSTYYMHLDSFADISQGDYVKEGTIIGYIGGSGAGIQDKYSPHLHYEVLYKGSHVNPANYYDLAITPEEYSTMVQNTADASEKITMHPSHRRKEKGRI